MHVIVVGAGIMGLCTAWALAREGHAVTVLEQATIPNPKGSSFDAHRLIRYTYAAAAGYTAMVAEAFRDWESLWRFLGQRLYVPTGTLVIGPEDAPRISESARTFDRFAIDYELLDPGEVTRRFPVITGGEIGAALYTSSGGVLLAGRIVAALATSLGGAGVSLRPETWVAEVDPRRARARLSSGETLAADALVLTAGPWISRLLPAYAQRVTPSRQAVAYLSAPADLHASWRACPMVLESRARIGFYIVPPVADTPLKVGDHGFTLTGDPDEDRELTAEAAQIVAGEARHRLRDYQRYRVLGGRHCFYTVEPQERFIIEPVERSWVVSGFSGHGFKFGPTIGRGVADAVTGRRSAAEVGSWAAGQAPGEGARLLA